jgi:palmitoyl-protein thioesterase
LTAEGRLVVGLSFCQDLCSVSSLNAQVPSAIAQIRSTIAHDARFKNGYIFIGHSQGASIARAVVEEMDDHQVRMLISLAGPQNGIFYGPQPSDAIPTQAFASRLGPKTIPPSIFNFSDYSPSDYVTGKFQSDFNSLVFSYPQLQDKLSVLNLGRSPVKSEWRTVNTFIPVVNNINPCDGPDKEVCIAAKQKRRANFLKLTSAHFFGSPADDVIAPWQSSILGQYTDVANTGDLLTNFPLLEPMDMKLSEEYLQDTYGLKTLDARGGLFLYDVPDVGHSCWVADSVPLGKKDPCLWKPVYENYLYPLLLTRGWGVV